MEPAKKFGQRKFQWPNEDTNGVIAKRFMKRKANKKARRYDSKEVGKLINP